NSEIRRNLEYPMGEDDCTYFASQVLREGGLAMPGTKNYNNRTEPNQWWYYKTHNNIEPFVKTYSWGGAQALHDYLVNTNVDGHNIAKQTRVISSVEEKQQPFIPGGAMPGDILFFDFGDGQGIVHTMVVAGEDSPYALDRANLNPNLDYSRTTVIDQHSNDRHHTFWSGNSSVPDWKKETIYVVHPFGKSDHPWSKTDDEQN
ncbi:amidase domain-containing protein, partial [Rhodococcus cerastii]|nr:amidase domain-containing protein [Rhodococcus cerastii]